MKRTFFALLIIFFFLGCAPHDGMIKKEPDAKGSEDMRAKLDSLIARETKTLNQTESEGDLKIKILSEGKTRSKLISKSDPVKYELNIPIGAMSEIKCTLTEQVQFSGMLLKSIYDNIAQLSDIEARGIKTIEADVLHNMGYIYLEVEYLTKDKKYGIVKLISISTLNLSLYCSHDEPGYKKTFFKVVDSLVKSSYVQSFINRLSNYDIKQIDIVYLNNKPVGYSEQFFITSKDKKEKNIMSLVSMIMKRTQNELGSNDSFFMKTYESKTGHLLSGGYYSYVDLDAEYEVELEKIATRQYQVKGEFRGKELNQYFQSEQPLLEPDFILVLYIEGKTSKKEWNFEVYIPSLSPVKPSKGKIVFQGKNGAGNKILEYINQPVRISIQADEKSYILSNTDFGNISFLAKRRFLDVK